MIQWQFSWPLLNNLIILQYKSHWVDEENLVRGYELNVLDGQHFLLFKNEARFRVFSFQLNKIKNLKENRVPSSTRP